MYGLGSQAILTPTWILALERFLTCQVYVQRVNDDTYKAKGMAPPRHSRAHLKPNSLVAESHDAYPRDDLEVTETQLSHCATSLALLLSPEPERADRKV